MLGQGSRYRKEWESGDDETYRVDSTDNLLFLKLEKTEHKRANGLKKIDQSHVNLSLLYESLLSPSGSFAFLCLSVYLSPSRFPDRTLCLNLPVPLCPSLSQPQEYFLFLHNYI